MDKLTTENRVYLDYAATAPMLPEVRETLFGYSAETFGNASTLYKEGKAARQALEGARTELAGSLGCSPYELFFCSGGTEAAGTLLEGIARGASEKAGFREKKHIVCAAFEHDAVLLGALSLKRLGFEVELLKANRKGRIEVEALQAALRPDTLFVAIMLAQNEVGTVQDVVALAACAHDAGALFMSDCVQALGKVPFSLADLDVDAACFSAHKLGGPVGVGAFYLKSSVPFLPRQLGGGQEQGKRSGTQNVSGAIAFALAAQLHSPEYVFTEALRLSMLRDKLLTTLTEGSKRIQPTVPIASADVTSHLPGYLHILVAGIESQTMILKLDELGFAVSGGSACSSGSLEPSHVLTSMGIAKDEAYGALRISLGKSTTENSCTRFAEALLSLL